jgi:tRNA(Ile)-lysidine synthase
MASTARSTPADPARAVGRAIAQAFATQRQGERALRSVCVGLSGGRDSVVLLHALSAWARAHALEVRALHVHHGLSPNADAWARSCRRLCRQLGVRLTVVRVEVDRTGGLGVEAAARAARLRAFDAQKADAVVLAHHREDQAETLLLQLLRGAGVRGLAAMAADSRAGPRILRPLLALPRSALDAYARAHRLDWIEDESNADTRYDRNFVRHRVLPLLNERWPAATATLARSAALLDQSRELIDALARADLAAALAQGSQHMGDGALPAAVLHDLGRARALELLRCWLRERGEPMPAQRRLEEALRQALAAGADRQVAVALGAATLRRYRGALYLTGTAPPPARSRTGERPAVAKVRWSRRARMTLPELGGTLLAQRVRGAGLAASVLRGRTLWIGVRPAVPGSALRLRLGTPPRARTLKNLWQGSAVPPWSRDRWPLLWLDDALVGVPGLALASAVAATGDAMGWQFTWVPDD